MAILQRFLIRFPFLFGGTFIEALSLSAPLKGSFYFPSYVEGLSIRQINIPPRMTAGPFVLHLEV